MSILALLALISSSALAATTLVSTSSDFYTAPANVSGTWIVYSGRTSSGCSSTSTTALCDSCASQNVTFGALTDPFSFACNEKEVHANYDFIVSLKSDSATAYPTDGCTRPIIAISADDSTKTLRMSNEVTYTTGTGAANQVITARFKFFSLCETFQGNINCEQSFNKTVRFAFATSCSVNTEKETGVAVNFKHRYVGSSPPMSFQAANPCNGNQANPYEGICHFEMMPGDQKAYPSNLITNNSSNYVVPNLESSVPSWATSPPDSSGMKYAALRLYFNDVSFDSVSSQSNKIDLRIATTGAVNSQVSLNDTKVTGLENGKEYFFVAGNVDQAGNATYFSSNNARIFTSGGTLSAPTIALASGTDAVMGQSAIPAQVFGLLDGKQCFVATAAFGSEMHRNVQDFRNFRDRALLTTKIGQSFVKTYYELSPPLANWIGKTEPRRQVARGLLLPLLMISQFTLALGLEGSLASLFFAFFVCSLLVVCGVVAVWTGRVLRRMSRPTLFCLAVLLALALTPQTTLAQEDEGDFDQELIEIEDTEVPAITEIQNDSLRPDTGVSDGWPPRNPINREVIPKHGGTFQMEHPGAAKGLIKIEKDGAYQYHVPPIPKSKATSFRFATLTPPRIVNGSLTYENMYGASPQGLLLDFEWQPFQGFGALGFAFGSGFVMAQGKGRFASGREALESYTLFVIPLSLSVVYRFEYVRRQWFVPFIHGGGTYYGLVELRDDNKRNLAGTPAVGGGGGIHFGISRWDRRSAFILSKEYGIADVWLTLEVRVVAALKRELDLSNQSISLGFTVDY